MNRNDNPESNNVNINFVNRNDSFVSNTVRLSDCHSKVTSQSAISGAQAIAQPEMLYRQNSIYPSLTCNTFLF